jgi:hypothetical protein
MKIKVKKIFGGRVSVRSYLVKYCKKTHKDLTIEFERQNMTVRWPDLGRYTTDGNTYTAKRFDQYIRLGDKYKLYDYIWRPDIEDKGWTTEGAKKFLSIREKLGIKSKHI